MSLWCRRRNTFQFTLFLEKEAQSEVSEFAVITKLNMDFTFGLDQGRYFILTLITTLGQRNSETTFHTRQTADRSQNLDLPLTAGHTQVPNSKMQHTQVLNQKKHVSSLNNLTTPKGQILGLGISYGFIGMIPLDLRIGAAPSSTYLMGRSDHD